MESQTIKSSQLTVEGIVAFGSEFPGTFRYRLSLKNDKLNIWLEDKKSKKQWETGALGMGDFVPADAVIPRADIADYFVCFHNALECSLKDSSSQRGLKVHANDHLGLEFVLKLKLFASEWTPTYKFDLKPIPLEKVDILESKLRDLEERLTKQEDERAPSEPIYLHVTSANSASSGGMLTWGKVDKESFKIEPSGAIVFERAGVYVIHVIVRHSNRTNGETFCLMNGKNVVGSCSDASGSIPTNVKGYYGHHDRDSVECNYISSALMVTLEVKANTKLSVMYKGQNSACGDSYFTAFLLR